MPIAIAGVAGSFMVIAVNGWMNHPTGLPDRRGGVVDVHPWAALFNATSGPSSSHMYLAGYIVAGFLVAAVYALALLRGDATGYVRSALDLRSPSPRAGRAGAGAWSATGRAARSPSTSR